MDVCVYAQYVQYVTVCMYVKYVCLYVTVSVYVCAGMYVFVHK